MKYGGFYRITGWITVLYLMPRGGLTEKEEVSLGSLCDIRVECFITVTTLFRLMVASGTGIICVIRENIIYSRARLLLAYFSRASRRCGVAVKTLEAIALETVKAYLSRVESPCPRSNKGHFCFRSGGFIWDHKCIVWKEFADNAKN
jgi:hypothetical protein